MDSCLPADPLSSIRCDQLAAGMEPGTCLLEFAGAMAADQSKPCTCWQEIVPRTIRSTLLPVTRVRSDTPLWAPLLFISLMDHCIPSCVLHSRMHAKVGVSPRDSSVHSVAYRAQVKQSNCNKKTVMVLRA